MRLNFAFIVLIITILFGCSARLPGSDKSIAAQPSVSNIAGLMRELKSSVDAPQKDIFGYRISHKDTGSRIIESPDLVATLDRIYENGQLRGWVLTLENLSNGRLNLDKGRFRISGSRAIEFEPKILASRQRGKAFIVQKIESAGQSPKVPAGDV